jgi:EAL domain-containing protein (putative c-di-GMP-specific phosphodiesterase class I)
VVAKGADCSFAFQPIVDPFMQQVVSWEALLRTHDGDSPGAYFANLPRDEVYASDLQSKQVALSMASALGLQDQTLSLNLLPMTLVNIPNAVDFCSPRLKQMGLCRSKLWWSLPKVKPFPVLMNSRIRSGS